MGLRQKAPAMIVVTVNLCEHILLHNPSAQYLLRYHGHRSFRGGRLVSQARVILEAPLTNTIDELRPLPQLDEDVSALSSSSVGQKTVTLGTLEPPFHTLLKHWSKPAVVAAALAVCVLACSAAAVPAELALAVAAVLISREIFSPLQLLSASAPRPAKLRLPRLLIEWGAVVALLLFFGITLKLSALVPHQVLLSWFLLTPVLLLVGDAVSARLAASSGTERQRYIIIGANEVGVELERRASQNVGMGKFMGFFDFRSLERLPQDARGQFAGLCKEVAEFVRSNGVSAIYITLPMNKAPRINDMLREFRDTTASIYFVPDIFAYDLVQARCVEINGIPMLSICDTPFHGMQAVRKRAIDVGLSSIVLLLGWPLMLAAAIAVKLSSPGPVLFKQRRYGLNGEEILVYKFRSMRVCEDGSVVVQAKKEDERITPVGRFLRRTSLDELPQLFNVLEGKMSFVGPRPHAVAHNETYRKLISGYMIRHKIRPGMTGWAQVHGLRGETSTVEQMRLRVQYDLDYLRHWSLWLDCKILFKTAVIVMRGRNAY
jgi:putative colanic acid biosysnthesis UDP-glucose lipid carrier transferase